MLSDKQVKKKFKQTASENPDSYYPTTLLKSKGFQRKKCNCCEMYFWNVDPERKVCGDPACSGGFDVVSNNPSKVSLTYPEVWKKMEELFGPKGYESVSRYPVVARWNPTADFVMASIAAFQPYVITGEVDPPAKKLIIPQYSLRFGDVDNVGITGSHLTGFVMIGQHVFVEADEWNQEQLFGDIYEFLVEGIGLAKEEITIHEDAWAGGGSFGPCMEFFSRGVELFNQVYTMFEQTPQGDQELKLKVLDMGMGMERIAWFSQGKPNIYEATFPAVLEKLRSVTGIEMDYELYNKFSKYSAFLNVDEVDDIALAWQNVAEKMETSVDELRERILPMTALYSIAEHARSLLVALTDGALPSNVGGGYNLRVIYRRAQNFIEQFEWDINLADVADWHAEELKDLFPELSRHTDDVRAILDVEKRKFDANKEKAKQIVQKIIQKEVTTETLVELYDSQGIMPEIIVKEAKKLGKDIVVPDNFYMLVEELHEKKEQVHSTKRALDIALPDEETEVLYFDKYNQYEFSATVTHVLGEENEYVILDKTYFYPTSGGQLHDLGTLDGKEIVDVIKQDRLVIHKVPGNEFSPGQRVSGKIDEKRRVQLTSHHTATHIVNAAAKKVLGNHINQIGAKKTLEKATLDITHYDALSDEELQSIEKEANAIVGNGIGVHKFFLTRSDAEKSYGHTIYQGGAIPGNNLRMVLIGERNTDEKDIIDVECCAGTHLDNTKEVGKIKILKSNKISDGVVRLTFVAGERAAEEDASDSELLEQIQKALEVSSPLLIPGRSEELFMKWKKGKKLAKKGKELTDDLFVLTEEKESSGDILSEAAQILGTQQEHVLKTIQRFQGDLQKWKNAEK